MITSTTLIDNARRLGHETQTAAAAIELVTGKRAVSLCCWCADAPPAATGEVYRLPKGGECSHCAYVGRDCLVVLPEAVQP